MSSSYSVGTSSQSQHHNHHSHGGLADQLASLSKLHKSGELTDAEYEAAKKELLQ
jgi:hypothetical protein